MPKTALLLQLFALTILASPHGARGDEVFTIRPQSQVVLGEEGGDTFAVISGTRGEVIVEVNPAGEDCALRFALRKGEQFALRIRSGAEQTLSCRIGLSGIGKDQSVTFLSSCEAAATASEPRCQAASEAP